MTRRVVITGIGWITPLGHDIEDVWQRMLAGESGVGPTTIFDATTFPTTFSAEVRDFSLDRFLGEGAVKHTGASRNTKFALAAAAKAWESAALGAHASLDTTRVGIYLGGGEGPINFEPFVRAAIAGCRNEAGESTALDTVRWAKLALEILDPVHQREQEPHMAAAHLAVHFNAEGPNFNTLTACAASTQAIGQATELIRYGDADVMISGGTHSMIHPLGVTGFNRLTALSTRNDSYQTASRPFDRTRDGFVLGEGAGMIILEELEFARERGARILAEIVGYGSTADAFRITDIHENGRGAIAAMHGAIAEAGLTPGDIDYISAHGTGTEENDKIETLAVRTFLGSHADSVAISSVKSMVGHLIAAAGAVELITCILAIRDDVAPPTINYETPDPRCDLDYVPNKARPMPIRIALSNSFGFGGQNDTILVRAFDE
ncbi:MAG: beta-ketoacyl-[acyl-carrier-protein] synthase family protein [Planctomycetes bacterium]|nr:beta-ketoacyl-[acyl-carrier-protein] synthase family protein [Planctomycetota bacterium]